MKKSEIRKAIKEVYQKLWELLSLLEETEFFNKVPKGEKMAEDSNGDDAIRYVERKIAEIRKSVEPLFPEEGEIVRKLDQIIDETEHFAKQYEMPGVVTSWKQINPQLLYFDCAFDIMEKCPEFYMKMRRGLTDIHLSCYPDSELIAQRNEYFARVKEQYKRKKIECSEDRIFQDELLNTLTLLFEDAFKEYL